MPIHHTTSGALIAGEASIGIAGKPLQFIDRARKLHLGFRALAPLGALQAPAAIFLASWCLELSLKAHLASKGQGKTELRSIQHDLAALWTKAAILGLRVPSTPPHWCMLLSATHNDPYHQRYPNDAAASSTPSIQVVEAELTALLTIVEQSLQ